MHISELMQDPFAQFETWFKAAQAAGEVDVEAMALATVDEQGLPAVRYLLYKGVNAQGFLLYTNYHSCKAQALFSNPYAALAFYWPKSYRQVRIEGKVHKLSAETSEAYFRSRSRDSQLGAWASHQSQVIASRDALLQNYQQMKTRFTEKEIPCPEFWGGFCLVPTSFEFWQGQQHRLHDRFHYQRKHDAWSIVRLAP